MFLPAHLRGLDPRFATTAQKAELRKVLDETRRGMEDALATLFDRLVIPVRLPGESAPRALRFFELAAQIAKESDPAARIAPSGGVVRSTIGFLYEEMLREAERNPGFNSIAFLRKIAAGDHPIFDKRGQVMAFDIRGVGSDFDILLDADEKKFGVISARIKALFQVHGANLDKSTDPDDLNKAFFTIADLKPMKEQTERSVRQGGASTDLLAFDLETGKLVEPTQVPGIVDELMQGYYRYLPPQPGAKREAPLVTSMRGPRALVEMPFMSLRPEDRKQLDDELRAILRDILENGIFPPEKAIDQINKLRRNGRLSMANNAIDQSPANTTLALLRSIAEALEKKRQLKLLDYPTEIHFEPYTPRYPLSAARVSLTESLPVKIRKYLVSKEDFLRDHTADGFLYHGTSAQGALGILRGGFRQSEYRVGIHRGTYSTSDQNLASTFARLRGGDAANGYVLKLPLQKDSPFSVFDLNKFKAGDKAAFARLEAEAKSNGMELADWLGKKYGIDFIILDESVVLIKNTEALGRVTLPSLAQQTVEHLNKEILNPEADFARLLIERKRLEDARPLFKALDIEVGRVPTLEEISERALQMMQKVNDPAKLLSIVNQLPPTYRARISAKELGGRTYAELFAEAFSREPSFAPAAYNASPKDFDLFGKAMQDPEWGNLVFGSLNKITARASQPGISPLDAYRWLENLKLLLDVNSSRPSFDKARVARIIQSIPDGTFASVRKAAAHHPLLFGQISELQAALRSAGNIDIDLVSETLALRLKEIKSSKSVSEKLQGLELLAESMNIFSDLGKHPDVMMEIRRIIPSIRTGEEIEAYGTSLILGMVQEKNFRIDRDVNDLILRIIKEAERAAPTQAAFSNRSTAANLLGDVARILMFRTEDISPEVVGEMKRLHGIYRFDRQWPGHWDSLKAILEK